MAKDLYTAIELTERECKLAQVAHRKEGIVVENLLQIEFKGQTETAAVDSANNAALRAAEIQKRLKKARWKPGKVTLSVPKNLITTRFVRLPSTHPQELAKMARFEAGRHIPFNIDRHIISHHIFRLDELKGSELLIAAVDSAVLEEMLSVIRSAGLKVDSVDVSTLGLYNYYRLIQQSADKSHQIPTTEQKEAKWSTTIINIGQLTTDIVITQEGKLLFNRSCSVGIAKLLEELHSCLSEEISSEKDILAEVDVVRLEESLQLFFDSQPSQKPQPDPDKPVGNQPLQVLFSTDKSPAVKKSAEIIRQWLERLLLEIRRTYDFAKREFDCYPPRELYLAGEGRSLKNIEQFFHLNLGVNTHFLNPVNDLRLANPELISRIPQPSAFVASLGSALREMVPGAIKINLIPETYVKRELALRRRTSYIVQGTMILAIIILGIIFVSQQLSYRHRLLEWYMKENKTLKPIMEELIDKEKKLRIIHKHIRDKRSALAILEAISQFEFMPQKVALTNFKFEKEGNVILNGHALSIKELNLFESALEKSDLFESIITKERATTTLPGRAPEVYVFTITCQVKK